MKCPECRAWTTVIETRLRSDGSRRRTYQCGNLHKFITLEMVATVPPGKKHAVIGHSSTATTKDDVLSTLPRVSPHMPKLKTLVKP